MRQPGGPARVWAEPRAGRARGGLPGRGAAGREDVFELRVLLEKLEHLAGDDLLLDLGNAVAVAELADRAPKALADNETLSLGRHTVRWIDAPHVPHAWDNGFLMVDELRALLCGDLFTQPGADHPPVTEADILGPSETMRAQLDYFAHGPDTARVLDRLAALEPQLLACMHGSAWRGDGARLIHRLRDALTATQ